MGLPFFHMASNKFQQWLNIFWKWLWLFRATPPKKTNLWSAEVSLNVPPCSLACFCCFCLTIVYSKLVVSGQIATIKNEKLQFKLYLVQSDLIFMVKKFLIVLFYSSINSTTILNALYFIAIRFIYYNAWYISRTKPFSPLTKRSLIKI